MINVVVVGAVGSGKSSLCVRYIHDKFIEQYDTTIEDCYRHETTCDGHSIIVDVIDSSGQDEYLELQTRAIENAHAIIITVALDKESTLRGARRFIEMARNTTNSKARFVHRPIILAFTKVDISRERQQVFPDMQQEFLTDYDLTNYVHTSALTGTNVTECFSSAIIEGILYQRLVEQVSTQMDFKPADDTRKPGSTASFDTMSPRSVSSTSARSAPMSPSFSTPRVVDDTPIRKKESPRHDSSGCKIL